MKRPILNSNITALHRRQGILQDDALQEMLLKPAKPGIDRTKHEECLLLKDCIYKYFSDMLEQYIVLKQASFIKKQIENLQPKLVSNPELVIPLHHPAVINTLKNFRLTMAADYLNENEDQCRYIGSVVDLAVGIFDNIRLGQIKLLEQQCAEASSEWIALKPHEILDTVVPMVESWWGLVVCFIYNVSPAVLQNTRKSEQELDFKSTYVDTISVTLSRGDPLRLQSDSEEDLKKLWTYVHVLNFDDEGTGLSMEPVVDQSLPSFASWGFAETK